MTYGPEPHHFKAQLPSLPQKVWREPHAQRIGERLLLRDGRELRLNTPKWQLGLSWMIARSHWPR